MLPCLNRGLPLDERQSAAELEAVLQHHHNLQEKLADDMLNLARNLKNNTLAAQNIIKQDNQVSGQRRQSVHTAVNTERCTQMILFFGKINCYIFCSRVSVLLSHRVVLFGLVLGFFCTIVCFVFVSLALPRASTRWHKKTSNLTMNPSQTLGQSMRQADMNMEKLKTESERLEQHTKKSINWLLWLMLILVSFIFISMILFIRIFPRLR